MSQYRNSYKEKYLRLKEQFLHTNGHDDITTNLGGKDLIEAYRVAIEENNEILAMINEARKGLRDVINESVGKLNSYKEVGLMEYDEVKGVTEDDGIFEMVRVAKVIMEDAVDRSCIAAEHIGDLNSKRNEEEREHIKLAMSIRAQREIVDGITPTDYARQVLRPLKLGVKHRVLREKTERRMTQINMSQIMDINSEIEEEEPYIGNEEEEVRRGRDAIRKERNRLKAVRPTSRRYKNRLSQMVKRAHPILQQYNEDYSDEVQRIRRIQEEG
jgi:hypothetical protein